MNLKVQAARFRLNLLSSEDLVSISVEALVQGSNSSSLAQLAGESSPIMSDVSDLFLQGLKESGIIYPSQHQAIWIVLADYLQSIFDGIIDPYDGMRKIDKDIYWKYSKEISDTKYMGDAFRIEHCFCWYRELQDAEDGSTLFYYSDLPKSEAIKKFKEHLIEEAGKALQRIKVEQKL